MHQQSCRCGGIFVPCNQTLFPINYNRNQPSHCRHHHSQLLSRRPLSRQCEVPWQFSDGLRHSSVALGMLSITHIMPALVLLTVVGVGMRQCMIWTIYTEQTPTKYLYECKYAAYSFRQLFPDKNFSPRSPWLLVKSLTAVKFPDISRFSREVVTLYFNHH